jgi:hypothetical protein
MTGDCRLSHSARAKLSAEAKLDNVTGSHILQSYLPRVPYKVGGRDVYLRREREGTSGNVPGERTVIFGRHFFLLVIFCSHIFPYSRIFFFGLPMIINTARDSLHVYWPAQSLYSMRI